MCAKNKKLTVTDAAIRIEQLRNENQRLHTLLQGLRDLTIESVQQILEPVKESMHEIRRERRKVEGEIAEMHREIENKMAEVKKQLGNYCAQNNWFQEQLQYWQKVRDHVVKYWEPMEGRLAALERLMKEKTSDANHSASVHVGGSCGVWGGAGAGGG